MKITFKWLKEQQACSTGINWFIMQDQSEDTVIIRMLIKEDKLRWANWLFSKVQIYKQEFKRD